jgi:hypothetical protein
MYYRDYFHRHPHGAPILTAILVIVAILVVVALVRSSDK